MVAWRLAALWLGLIAPASVPEARGAGGVVIADALEVLDEPDDSAFASGELRRGARVAVVAPGRGGWVAIAPPADAFDWVAASTLQDRDDGTAEVVVDRASVRSGCPGARMPGPPRPPLPRGAVVRLIDRPPLRPGPGTKGPTWRAIEPPEGEVRFVRAEGVKLDPTPILPPSPGPIDPDVRPAQGTRPGEADLAIQKFEDALRRSRLLDDEVARVRQELAHAQVGTERGYDARGLLQASSRRVDGEKVHALIGPEGRPIAYLSLPPGLPVARLLARKVGVRGEVHYNESLGARLITVRDLDPLDKSR